MDMHTGVYSCTASITPIYTPTQERWEREQNDNMVQNAIVVGGGLGALYVANKGVKTATGKGVIGNVWSASDRLFGGKSSVESSGSSTQKPNNNQNSNTSKENLQKKTKHNKTPSSNLNISDYSTKEEFSKAKAALHATDSAKVGNSAVRNALHEAADALPKGSPQRTAIAQMMGDLRNGRPVDAAQFTELTGKDAPTSRGGSSINMKALGEEVKAVDNSRINAAELAHRHPTPQAKSWYKEMGKSFMKSKVGKTLGVVGGLYTLTGSLGADEPQEGEYPSGDMGSQPSQPKTPPAMSTMDTAMIMGTATVSNGITAAFGVQELKAGQQVATKAVEKTGGKLLGKMAGKLIPGVGLALGAKFASDEFDKGNYGRAAMEMLSGVTSLVPGIGTLASAAIDMGLATESVMNPEQEKQKLQTVSGAKPKTVAAALGKSIQIKHCK